MDSNLNFLKINFLGNFQFEFNHNLLSDTDNRSNRVWELLAYLIVNRHRSVSTGELIDVFWGGENIANPQNSLKAIVFRGRNLLMPLLGDDINPIQSSRGYYRWSCDIPCVIDTEIFKTLCQECNSNKLSNAEKLEKYKLATDIYKGDFLVNLRDKLWTVSSSVHLHQLYLSTIKSYSELLIEEEDFEGATLVCLKSLSLDSLDDEIHTLIIKSLMLQGKEEDALAHYEKATEHLYHNLGVHPSNNLRNLYLELKKFTNNVELDLDIIQEELQETSKKNGAFLCDYGFFKDIYKLEARKAQRGGYSIHIVLMTIVNMNDKIPPLDSLCDVMYELKNSLITSLRKGDVISRYSGAQFIIMLPCTSYESSHQAIKRSKDCLYSKGKQYSKFKIQTSFRTADTFSF